MPWGSCPCVRAWRCEGRPPLPHHFVCVEKFTLPYLFTLAARATSARAETRPRACVSPVCGAESVFRHTGDTNNDRDSPPTHTELLSGLRPTATQGRPGRPVDRRSPLACSAAPHAATRVRMNRSGAWRASRPLQRGVGACRRRERSGATGRPPLAPPPNTGQARAPRQPSPPRAPQPGLAAA